MSVLGIVGEILRGASPNEGGAFIVLCAEFLTCAEKGAP
jgi:hypothetical protein